jgi:hypothetical protein
MESLLGALPQPKTGSLCEVGRRLEYDESHDIHEAVEWIVELVVSS